MSEPEGKLDLTSLDEALGGDKDVSVSGGKAATHEGNDGGYEIDEASSEDTAAKERAQATMDKSNTLSADRKEAGANAAAGTDVKADAVTRSRDTDLEKLDPTSRQIKAMFPDTDTDTIQAVVAAEGGDFERAINTLLQMSDPSYVPPPMVKESTQTRSDAELARVLAAEEEDHARRQQQTQQQHAQQSSGFFPPSARGGGLGALFGGGRLSPSDQRPAQSPSYDPSVLAYQPRVRRATSGTPTQQQPPVTQVSQRQGSSPGEGGPQVWPGPKEAKAWQEDINKMAETGFAKAASTFSALRQRGEQTLQGIQQNRAQASGNAAAASSSGAQGPSGSFFGTWAGRKNPNASPNINSGKGFDKDASPVGDNELAKILARGRNDRSSGSYDGTGQPQRKPSAPTAMVDRYKSGASSQDRRAYNNAPQTQTKGKADDDDDDLGWDDAGRTGASDKEESDKPFEPIKINDSTTTSSEKQAAPPTRNAVSLMEGSAGRGISPSPRNQSSESNDTPTSNNKGKQMATQAKSYDDDNELDDGNSDDLEYVANPFEDDD